LVHTDVPSLSQRRWHGLEARVAVKNETTAACLVFIIAKNSVRKTLSQHDQRHHPCPNPIYAHLIISCRFNYTSEFPIL
jgi:hypothetical protein